MSLPLWPFADQLLDNQHQNNTDQPFPFPRYISFCPYSLNVQFFYLSSHLQIDLSITSMAKSNQNVNPLLLQPPRFTPEQRSLSNFLKLNYLIDWIMGRNFVSGPGCDFCGVASVTYPIMPILERVSGWNTYKRFRG